MQDEIESQLSAMFDGELPAAECELLSRRIARDERLRDQWSRYALIGAAMRSEPVAAARGGFAARVSAALTAEVASPSQVAGALVPVTQRRSVATAGYAAVAASVAVAVAVGSIAALRHWSVEPSALTAAAVSTSAVQSLVPSTVVATAPTGVVAAAVAQRQASNGHASSYITPVDRGGNGAMVRTELADYIVAHSEYSTPLMRRNLLTELVGSNDVGTGPIGVRAPGAAASAR